MGICVGCWMNWRRRTSTRQHSQRHHVKAMRCTPTGELSPFTPIHYNKVCFSPPQVSTSAISIMTSRLHLGHRLRLRSAASPRLLGAFRSASGLTLGWTALRAIQRRCTRISLGTSAQTRFEQKSRANQRFLKVAARDCRCNASRVRI